MKSVRWNLKYAPLALALAATLAACGGGGGGDVDSTSVTLSGVAAKGALTNASVTAHAIKADGSIDPAVLAKADTTDFGVYENLSFNAVQGAPYVILVTAKSGKVMMQLDEVTGESQPMPADFSMRSLFTKSVASAVTTTASITPFSEMAVAAAARGANGVPGITAANAAQAIANVTTLLGFNPTTVTPSTITAAAQGDQQKLALFLTALSRLANDSALGCTATAPGDRVKCVVDTLASTATLGSTIPGVTPTNVNVATALSGAILAVAADSRLTGGAVDTTTLTSTLVTLAGNGTTTPATTDVTAITSAKLLFTAIKSDVTSLFSDRHAASLGAANVEANTFITAMKDVQVPAEMLIKDSGALLMGIDLYNDFKAGRETSNFRFRGENQTATNPGAPLSSHHKSDYCGLYTDSASTTPATSSANALYIGCRATYYTSKVNTSNGSVITEWRHGFLITPKGGDTFGYGTSAKKRVQTTTCGVNGCTDTVNSNVLMTNADGTTSIPYTGTVSVTIGNDAYTTNEIEGHITGFSLNGKLPGAFKSGSNTLANNHHDVALSGTVTFGKDATGRAYSVSKLTSGLVTAFADDASTLGTLTINSGSFTGTDVDVTTDGSSPGDVTAGGLDLKWTTAKSEVAGMLDIGNSVYDINGDHSLPSSVKFSGALRNKGSNGTFADFISGSITGVMTGYERYNRRAPLSASNDYTPSMSFALAVTAPGRPQLELSGNFSRSEFTKEVKTSSLQYRTLAAGGTPRMVISISTTQPTATTQGSFKLSEAGSNLSMTVVKGAPTTDLLYNNTLKVGTFNSDTKLLTFTNGEFISLDAGT